MNFSSYCYCYNCFLAWVFRHIHVKIIEICCWGKMFNLWSTRVFWTAKMQIHPNFNVCRCLNQPNFLGYSFCWINLRSIRNLWLKMQNNRLRVNKGKGFGRHIKETTKLNKFFRPINLEFPTVNWSCRRRLFCSLLFNKLLASSILIEAATVRLRCHETFVRHRPQVLFQFNSKYVST